MKILLVEDNPGDARLTRELLKEVDTKQFEVVLANRLSAAIDLLKSSVVDAVLLDLGLPDSDGIDTFSALHASAPGVPMIVLSGVTDEAVALKTVQLGAQDYLVKGVFDGSMLNRVIHYAIERQRLEESLRESEKRFRELADLLPQTIFEVDLGGHFIYFNRYGLESTGYTWEELGTGVNAIELFIPEQRDMVAGDILKILSGGKFDAHEYTVLRKDGSTYPALMYANAVIRNGRPIGVRGIVLDITERKKIEQMKTDFVSFISHQLRAPVAGLLNYINNMLDGITGSLNDKQTEYLNEMRDVCARNSRLIADLLNISRLERGVVSVNIQQVKLRSIVDLAVQEYSKSIKEKRLALNIKGVDQDVSVLADSDKLTEVLKNVVHNALKFTHEGSINIEIMSEGNHGIVKVKDTGIGIPEEVMRDLFKREKILSGAVAVGGGAGLGLYIAKGFMQRQGGDITVESATGKGSTFIISLPRK